MGASASGLDLVCDDDFAFSPLLSEKNDQTLPRDEDDQALPKSNAKYVEQRNKKRRKKLRPIRIRPKCRRFSGKNKRRPPLATASNRPLVSSSTSIETGESSQSFCEICAETKVSDDMFKIEKCSHSFCTDCIRKHVVCKIQDNIVTVPCPGLDCKSVLELDSCRSMIPNEVLARWDELLCESLILVAQKFYCPFKDCSALLVNDTDGMIRESECPICRRLFCAQCSVPWHSGIGCEEFQRLNEDERGREDLMVRELARDRNWMRCPCCKFYVEKNEGCLHMTCRCKFQFCYACGSKWSDTHGGCQRQ
ncbi:unnamed protein product [Ilex paraguariensis]|uniref:RBR-type E3 ubiquitin transferase n=1 Tax=Ilex paraguariensis TaxID=185542 RepID=A0ABC8TD86_9AQUA